MKKIIIQLAIMAVFPALVFAGDGATILFKEGQVAYISNGYATLAQEFRNLDGKNASHKIIELKLESSPFLINISEIVLICRDRCTSLEINDPRKTSTKGNN